MHAVFCLSTLNFLLVMCMAFHISVFDLEYFIRALVVTGNADRIWRVQVVILNQISI
jgi:hypothetical protein